MKIVGNKNRVRLSVYRTNRHIYAQLINDFEGKVVTGVSSLSEEVKKIKAENPTALAKEIGKILAQKAKDKKITKIVFDRRRFKYHGQVKALAEGAREGGLEF